MGDRSQQERATFKSIKESTKSDWKVIVADYQPFARELADRILSHFRMLGSNSGGFAVDRMQHPLLTATLAHKAGEDEEHVVCAPRSTISATCWVRGITSMSPRQA